MSHLPKQSKGTARYSIHVSEYITKKDIGLGDVIQGATSAIGLQPCKGCERRAMELNRMLMFSSRTPK